jgi:HEAT repeat protein
VVRAAALLSLTVVLLAQQEVVRVDFGTTPARRVKLLRHPIAGVRMRAAMLLAHAPADEAIAGLLVALSDPDRQVRRAAADSVGVLSDERAVPFLAARLGREPSPPVITTLLLAMARCGGPYVGRKLTPFLEHPNRTVRTAAATALGHLGDAGQRDALWAALRYAPHDPGFEVRAAILDAFVELGWKEDVAKAITELEAAGAWRHWSSRAAICAAVGGAGIESRAEWLGKAMSTEEDPRVLAAGLGAMAKIGKLDEVYAALDHRQPAVRRAALVALEEAGDPRAKAQAAVMVRTDPDVMVRFESALVLHHLGAAGADDYLVDALRSRDPIIWVTALMELERKYGRSFERDTEAWTDFLSARTRDAG